MRASRRFIAAALAAVLLSACQSWAQIGFGAGHTRFNPAEETLTASNVATLEEAWSVALDAQVHDDAAVTEPIVWGEQVYVRLHGTNEKLQALDIDTGATRWTQQPLLGSPAIADDALLVPTHDPVGGGCSGRVSERDPATGDEIASHDTGSSFLYQPVIAEGVAVSTEWVDCGTTLALVARDAETFEQRWSYPATNNGFDSEVPTVVGGQAFVSGIDTYAETMAFDLDCASPCAPTWSVDASPVDLSAAGIPVAGPGNQVFVGSVELVSAQFQRTFYALDRGTGAVLWQGSVVPAAGNTLAHPGMAVAGDTLFVAHANQLEAYAAGGCGAPACAPKWTATLSSQAGSSSSTQHRPPIAVAGGVVYVGSWEGVEAFPAAGCSAATCAPLTIVPTTPRVLHVAVSNGKLLVVSGSQSASDPYRLAVYAPS